LDQLANSFTHLETSGHQTVETDNNQSAFQILYPDEQTIPFIFASPHSGRRYPTAFIEASRLTPVMLRRSEDSFIDELFSKAPNYGAPLLKATFPRAYVDPNREPFELDPTMFEDQLPDYVNTNSAKISAGLGTVARVVINGENIYRKKLKFLEIKRRVESSYFPYHQALQQLIENTRIKFGFCILIDCHSMPSIGDPMDGDTGNNRVDIVLGNNHDASCAPQLLSYTSASLKRQGLSICRNKPYSGGYTTCHYGKPDKGVHALQIEINRSLYMNETNIEKHGGFFELSDKVTRVIFDLSKFNLN
jgi:N-formylglutamate amidohydrolase